MSTAVQNLLSSKPDVGSGASSGAAPSSGSSLLSVLSNPIAGIANTLLSGLFANQRNKESIAQWRRENEYNLPINQVSRLLAAGLNPALMYENGASGLISAGSPDIQSAQPALQGVDPLTAAQIANINAKTKKTESETSNIAEQLGLIKQHIELTSSQNALLKEQSSYYKKLSATEQARYDNLFVDYRFKTMSLYDRVDQVREQAHIIREKSIVSKDELLSGIRSAIALASFYEEKKLFVGFEAATNRINALANYSNAATQQALAPYKAENYVGQLRLLEQEVENYYQQNRFLDASFVGRVIGSYTDIIGKLY